MKILTVFLFSLGLGSAVSAAEQPVIVDHNRMMDHGDGHLMDMDGGMVMGQNKDKLPAGCDRVSEDVQVTVHAGRKFSKDFPGTMFGFDKHEWRVKPCTRLTVNFINEDPIRHQWMMHGLPKFMYDKGMFHLEVTGPAKVSGTLILPSEDRTYLVHCDIAQHMEKGMKGQLIVGKGSGTFPSIPGITDPAIFDNYAPSATVQPEKPNAAVPAPQAASSATGAGTAAAPPAAGGTVLSGSLVLGFVAGVFGAPAAVAYYNRRLKGRSFPEVLANLTSLIKAAACRLADWLSRLYQRIRSGKRYLPKGDE